MLAALAVSSTLVSCGDEKDRDVQTDNSSDMTPNAVDEGDGFVKDNLPDLDYDGRTVTFLAGIANDVVEFSTEEETGDVVNDAVFKRNQAVSERLNVELVFQEEPNTYNERATFVNKLTSSIMAGEKAYDAVAGYSMSIASLASNAMLLPLNDYSYIDFSKPWWSDNLLSQAKLNGKLYFASGDISTKMICSMFAVFFNKSLINDYNLDNPYELVLDGKWTLDKLIEMSTGIYSDVNGDGKKDIEDKFGFYGSQVFMDGFYFGSGLKVTDIATDGSPVISEDFRGVNGKIQSLLEKLTGFLHNSEDVYAPSYSNAPDHQLFIDNTILFSTLEVRYATSELRDVPFEFGLLPYPKFDEAQDNYYTTMSFPYTLYGIPLDAEEPEMSAAVLEALASESYRTVSPALFEIALKVKYSHDDDTAKVYDILKSSVVFDIGRVFNDSMGGMTYSIFRDSVVNNNPNWASTFASKQASLESAFENLTKNLD